MSKTNELQVRLQINECGRGSPLEILAGVLLPSPGTRSKHRQVAEGGGGETKHQNKELESSLPGKPCRNTEGCSREYLVKFPEGSMALNHVYMHSSKRLHIAHAQK